MKQTCPDCLGTIKAHAARWAACLEHHQATCPARKPDQKKENNDN